MRTTAVLIWVGAWAALTLGATPVAKSVKSVRDWHELLANGDCARSVQGRLEHWDAYGSGYAVDPEGGRGGGLGAMCDSTTEVKPLGLSQTLTLNQTDVRPFMVSAWSKAEQVGGVPDADYSLYVDLVYADGTPCWGLVAPFSVGTHDWEYRQLRIVADKPVRTLTVNVLLRGQKGKAWFDDISLKQMPSEPGWITFDGTLIKPLDGTSASRPAAELQIRDVAAGSDFFRVPLPRVGKPLPAAADPRANDTTTRDGRAIEEKVVPELQLAVSARHTSAVGGANRLDITVRDLSGRDRAIVVYYVIKLDAVGWRWFDDVRSSRVIAATSEEYSSTVRTPAGATARTSRYPFACVAGEREARSLLVPRAAVCHLGYHAGTRELYAAFDIGLARETKRPGEAAFTVCDGETDPRWGLRDTARQYYALLPDCFDAARIPRRQGNWMPFQAISSVSQPEDFQFAVHEGDNDVAWDNRHGVQPFVYVEPMTFWMTMPKDAPRNHDEAMAQLRRLQADPQSPQQDIARAVETSCTFEPDGRCRVDVLTAPWCDGAVFGNSADPDVPEPAGRSNLAHHNLRLLEKALTKAEPAGGLAGAYLDSLEGWGRLLNFRREHFTAADLPLTFEPDSYRPVILNVMATQEWTEYIADIMHRRGKLLMANAVPHDFPFLAAPLDLLGTETNWQQDGRFSPPDAAFFYLKRTLSWRKPYMFLMNTHFETWTTGMTERYMQLCLFYGMFPGFFSENAASNCYFANPAWYNRDRPLFRKYMPIIQRVAQAGWEPITRANCDVADVWIERWGRSTESGMYFTVMNTASAPRQATLTFDFAPAASLDASAAIVDAGDDREMGSASRCTLDLGPGEVRALRVQPR